MSKSVDADQPNKKSGGMLATLGVNKVATVSAVLAVIFGSIFILGDPYGPHKSPGHHAEETIDQRLSPVGRVVVAEQAPEQTEGSADAPSASESAGGAEAQTAGQATGEASSSSAAGSESQSDVGDKASAGPAAAAASQAVSSSAPKPAAVPAPPKPFAPKPGQTASRPMPAPKPAPTPAPKPSAPSESETAAKPDATPAEAATTSQAQTRPPAARPQPPRHPSVPRRPVMPGWMQHNAPMPPQQHYPYR